MNTSVDIIIPTHNRREVLPRAIDSVVAQTRADWLLWIVDDGSTDATEALVQDRYAELIENGKLQFIRTENHGVSKARNTAIRSSQSPWVAFLDSDDEWLPEKLEKQMTASERTDAPLIHGDEIWIRNGKRVNPKKKHQKRGGRIFEHCIPLCCISPSTAMIKRELLDEVGLFKEDYPVCEDYDLWLRICAKYDVHYIDEFLITKYGGHEDQLSRRFKAMDYWRVKSLMEFVESNDISDLERTNLKKIGRKKCEILVAGYEKHKNIDGRLYAKHWLSQFS